MEDQTQNSGGMGKMVMPTVIIALVVFAAIGFYLYQSSSSTKEVIQARPGTMMEQTHSVPSAMQAHMAYKNGAYSVVGNYVSPGGPRELNVTITLADGVISDAVVEGTATDATSKRFQGEFVSGFQPMVVGKNIDEVNLTKVAGSSLSPKGFNDALEKVKTEAQS